MAVRKITFTIEDDEHGTRVFEFIRREKVEDLMTAEDVTLGEWLRGLVAAPSVGSAKS